MPRKPKNQTNGKTDPVKKELPRTLDELWGGNGMSKYKTLDQDTYEKSLSEMTKTDLQDHAIKVGLAPIDDYPRLKRGLIRAFVEYKCKYAKIPTINNKTKAITPEIRKILAEGR
jgi:hypothetical protein